MGQLCGNVCTLCPLPAQETRADFERKCNRPDGKLIDSMSQCLAPWHQEYPVALCNCVSLIIDKMFRGFFFFWSYDLSEINLVLLSCRGVFLRMVTVNSWWAQLMGTQILLQNKDYCFRGWVDQRDQPSTMLFKREVFLQATLSRLTGRSLLMASD